MSEELSSKTIVIFSACGVLTLILLFIFVKRQLARVTLKSHRGPHIVIGHDAPKALERETARRIDRVREIQFEPQVLSRGDEAKYSDPQNINNLPPHYYRMKVVDSLAILEKEIRERQPTLWRYPNSNLRKFLMDLLRGPLHGANSRLIHQFCDVYDHARQDPTDFGQEEYKLFMDLLTQLLQCVKNWSLCCCSTSRINSVVNISSQSLSHNGKQMVIIHRPSSLDVENISRNETEL